MFGTPTNRPGRGPAFWTLFEEELKELCRKLKPLIGKRADGLWLGYISADSPQAKRESELLIQMVAWKNLNQRVDDASVLLPPSTAAAAQGEFPLGTVLYNNKEQGPLRLERENFVRHIGIYSITGAGKTNVAQLLLLSLLEAKIPFLVIDWKRSYRLLKTLNHPLVNEIRVFTVGRKSISPFHWNPLRGPPGVHPKTWISIVAESLERSHISGPGVADIFIELLDHQFEAHGMYGERFDHYANFFDARERLLKLSFKGRRSLWQDSCMRILNTFTFGPAAGAFNARHPVKLEELLAKPIIIELDQELPKPLRIFCSDLLLRWIHLHRLQQGESSHLRHVTFLEEAHNLFPKSQIEKQTTNSLENVFREIRGFGEGLVSITQHPSLIPIYILGNSNTQIYLSLQHEDDIVTAKRALFLMSGEEVYLDRLPVGEGIVKIKGRVNPCHVRFPLVPVERDGPMDLSNKGGADGEANVG